MGCAGPAGGAAAATASGSALRSRFLGGPGPLCPAAFQPASCHRASPGTRGCAVGHGWPRRGLQSPSLGTEAPRPAGVSSPPAAQAGLHLVTFQERAPAPVAASSLISFPAASCGPPGARPHAGWAPPPRSSDVGGCAWALPETPPAAALPPGRGPGHAKGPLQGKQGWTAINSALSTGLSHAMNATRELRWGPPRPQGLGCCSGGPSLRPGCPGGGLPGRQGEAWERDSPGPRGAQRAEREGPQHQRGLLGGGLRAQDTPVSENVLSTRGHCRGCRDSCGRLCPSQVLHSWPGDQQDGTLALPGSESVLGGGGLLPSLPRACVPRGHLGAVAGTAQAQPFGEERAVASPLCWPPPPTLPPWPWGLQLRPGKVGVQRLAPPASCS